MLTAAWHNADQAAPSIDHRIDRHYSILYSEPATQLCRIVFGLLGLKFPYGMLTAMTLP